MNVMQLIKELEKYDPLLEVVINSDSERPEGFENHFMLIPIEKTEEIESSTGDKMVILDGKMYDTHAN